MTSSGVKVDPTKIEGMLNWLMPTNPKQLRGFLGLIRYYRRFIRGYASIAASLKDLLVRTGSLG